ncbi:hypothetical protein ACFV2V_28515 [Streptomyces sp. NPDC059698]|uniref:hypothetical protein n=1 Tax=unclassified Streptomyces TaxID=2593676 RepID=UPI00093DAB9F|nr:hypothetical protein [Streptomyces sp. CB02366]OKJ39243.1 hypothetical protein AMK24_06090 [Streptomyces sp. CB02366]WSS55388.1 hypothetical protein OG543_08330 [Streptomyces sp. NBC_01178]
MLQCTAVTALPPEDLLRLLAADEDGPVDPEPYVLCELGAHDDQGTEHAAYLVPGRTPDSPALWFFWIGSEPERAHRTAYVPWCPVILRQVATGIVRRCTLHEGHSAAHSWDVADPLGDLVAERLVLGDSPKGDPYP